METEEACEEEDDFCYEEILTLSGVKDKPCDALKPTPKGYCRDCLITEKLGKKLIAQSYDRQKTVRSAPSKFDHSSWVSFTSNGSLSKSALCLSTMARIAMQKPTAPFNRNAANKGAMSQNLAAFRRRRLSDFSTRRAKSEDTASSQFVFTSNYKKYIETYRREKLLALQKHLFEDEIKAKFEEIAATIAVRRSFLDDLPETTESAVEVSASAASHKEDPQQRMLARSRTAMLPMNVFPTDPSNYKQNVINSGATSVMQQMASSSSKPPSQINLDLPSNNPNALAFQELQMKEMDPGKRGSLAAFQKPPPSQLLAAPGAQVLAPPGPAKQQTQQFNVLPIKPTASNGTNKQQTSVAKVFDVASFILDRDLLRRKMAEQLRSVESTVPNQPNANVKPLGKVGAEVKQRETSPSPMLVPNGLGKAYGNVFSNQSLNSEPQTPGRPPRLKTAGGGEVAARARAQLVVDKNLNTSDSQRNTDPSFSDVKYWLLMSVGGRNGNNGQNSGQPPNLASILKQQANELKALQHQTTAILTSNESLINNRHFSSNVTANDSASGSNVQVKLKTFNAAEAIPPSSKPPRPKHWSLTTGGNRFFFGAFNISARTGDETNGTTANTTSNANQPPPPSVVAAHNHDASSNSSSNNLASNHSTATHNMSNSSNATTTNINVINDNNSNNMQTTESADLVTVPTALLPNMPISLRLFSASNSRAKVATPRDQEVLPSTVSIVTGASQIANSMLIMNNEGKIRSHDYRQLLASNADSSSSSTLNIANVIVEALNRRNRSQNTSKRPSVYKVVRKHSAAGLCKASRPSSDSNNANGAEVSVTLRLTTPADRGQRLQQPKSRSMLVRSISPIKSSRLDTETAVADLP